MAEKKVCEPFWGLARKRGRATTRLAPAHSEKQQGEYHERHCIDRDFAANSDDWAPVSIDARGDLGVASLSRLPPLLVSSTWLLGVPAAHHIGAPRIRSNWYGRGQRTAQRLRCWDQCKRTAADSAHLSDHLGPPAALCHG